MDQQEKYFVISSRRNLCELNLDEYSQIKVSRRVLYKVIDLKYLIYNHIDSLVSKKVLSTENESLEDPIEIIFLIQFLRSLNPELSSFRFSEIVCPLDFFEKHELFGYYLFESIQDNTKKIIVRFCEDKDLNSDDINPTQETINNISIEIRSLPVFIFELLKMQKGFDFELFDDFRRGIDKKYMSELSEKSNENFMDSDSNSLKDRETLIQALKEIKNKIILKGGKFSLTAASDYLPRIGRSTLYEWLPKAGLQYDSQSKSIVDKETGQIVV